MFGKRRNKEDGGDERYEHSEAGGTPLGGAESSHAPEPSEPARPLYGGETSGSTPAGTTSDDDFLANLEADLNAALETTPAPEPVKADVAMQSAPEELAAQPEAPKDRSKKRITRDGDEMLGLLSTIESQLSELQRLKADRESLIDDLEQARQDIDAQREILSQREMSVQALENEALENQRITEGMLSEARQREEELERAKAAFEEQRAKVEQLEQTLGERSTELESRESELNRRFEELESSERAAADRERELREQFAGEYESRLSELQRSLDAARGEIESLRSELGDRVAEIELLHEDTDRRLVDQERTLREEFASRLENEKQSVDERVSRLEGELAESRKALEEQNIERERIEGERAEAAAKLESLRSELESAHRSLSESGEAAEQVQAARSRIAELEAEIAGSQQRLGQAEQELTQMRERCEGAESRIAELNAALEAKQAEQPATPAQPGIDPAEIAKRDRAIELLKSKLDQVSTRCKQLDEQLKAAPAAAPVGDAQANARMDAMQQKLLARQQELDVIAHKLDAREKSLKQREGAGGSGAPKSLSGAMSGTEEEREALRKESEQLYMQREALAEAKAAVDRSAKKVAAKAAKGKAVNVVLSAVVTLAILAFGSWYVVGEIAKPVHVASVELGADPQANPTPSQLEAWQAYHEALLEDPQFHELAARRLKARGYTQYGTPSDVREMVSSGLIAMESSVDGRMTLLYTGEGADRTQRILETFSGALSSFANETRDHRYDSAATAILVPASIDPTPIEDPRMNLFAMVFGGACAFALFSSLVLWRRMSRDISEFDSRLSDDLGLPVAPGGTEAEGGASSEGRRLMF